MLSTKNFAKEKNDIDSRWVFEYYLSLPERLSGQDLKIKSVFNPTERTPSMFIYFDSLTNQYKYKDFSTGNQGSGVDLVKDMNGIDYKQALFMVIEDYNSFVLKNGSIKPIDIKPVAKYKVDFAKRRGWLKEDADYWLPYNIGTSLLDEYNVRPLEYYTMIRESTGEITDKITINKKRTYGYYTKHNELNKIYHPEQDKYKFIKIGSNIQGLDQLKYNKPTLVICSSLKDVMCLRSFNFNIEAIAPDSENTIIKPHIIQLLKSKYKSIITLFDNDKAGHAAIEKYLSLYGIQGTYLDIEKDLSDAVKIHSVDKVFDRLVNRLREVL